MRYEILNPKSNTIKIFPFNLSWEGRVYRRTVIIIKEQGEVQASDGTWHTSSVFQREDVDVSFKYINIPISLYVFAQSITFIYQWEQTMGGDAQERGRVEMAFCIWWS